MGLGPCLLVQDIAFSILRFSLLIHHYQGKCMYLNFLQFMSLFSLSVSAADLFTPLLTKAIARYTCKLYQMWMPIRGYGITQLYLALTCESHGLLLKLLPMIAKVASAEISLATFTCDSQVLW